MKSRNPASQKGQALIAGILLFAAGTSVLLSGLGYAQTKDAGDIRASSFSKQSFFSSESALEDSIYRLKTSKNIGSTDEVMISGSQGTASITAGSSGKQIASLGMDNNYERNTGATLSLGQGISFNYGMQAGDGGISIGGSSGVYGNVYANGPITSDWSGFITGTAIAANSQPLTDDQSNTTPIPPPQDVLVGAATSRKDFAQSFTPSSTAQLSKISFYIEKTGNPSDITVDIVSDSSGAPGTVVLATGTISASSVTNNYTWEDADFSSNPTINADTTYWIVLISGNADQDNCYTVAANTYYVNGTGKIGRYGFSWSDTTPSGLDIYFNLYLGGAPVSILGPGQSGFNIGQNGVGDAYADIVSGVNVSGNLYCQSGSLNNKPCDTSRADPAAQSFPVTSEDISQWKSDASAGGIINGDEHIGSSNGTLGPKEIDGNLTVDSGGTLTISGTIYVKGNVNISGGSNVVLSSGYGADSGVIVADGTINVSNGSTLSGSGTSGSYIMLVTTNAGSSAVSISGGSGSVILNAQNGTVNISGGGRANEVTGNAINITGGSSVTYQSGLANTNFSSGDAASYSISGWQEMQ